MTRPSPQLRALVNRACLRRESVVYSVQDKGLERELMVKAWQRMFAAPIEGAAAKPLDWRRRMSDHIAYALLVYTALQIFVTMGALRSEGASLLPYMALVVLVGAIIPACRRFERRWNQLSDVQAANPEFAPFYRRDRLMLWLLAIGLPFAITGMFRLLALFFERT